MPSVKILTIHQPWAHLICAGEKKVENRSWPTSYRGPVLIHAGKSRKSLKIELARATMPEEEMAFGAIVGLVEVVDCVELADAPADRFASGPWCWLLANPKALRRPIPCNGQLGLKAADEELVRQVLRQR